MGCCVSTTRGSNREKEVHSRVGLESFHQKQGLENRAPPTSAEEETVKEVLSETPNSKARIFISREEEKKKTQIEKSPAAFVKIQVKDKEKEKSLDFNMKKTEPPPKSVPAIEESASEDVSEICSVSLSETLSTLTDRRDEEDEVRQPRVLRSPARSGSRKRVVGRSPNRKLHDQSPSRRNGGSSSSSVRLVQSKEPPGPVRRGSRPDPKRKDPGECSGRRSRSPSVNRSVMGRSPSGRRTNQSPSKVRRDTGECGNSKKVEHQHQKQHQQQQHQQQQMEGKWPSSSSGNNNGALPNESLENPLVSLECFIFL